MHPLAKVIDKITGHEDAPSGFSNHNRSRDAKDTSRSTRRLPVLLFPGFMSSALEVKKSSAKKWVGNRVWLNVASAGFSSIYFGSALKKNEEKRERGEDYDEELHLEYQKELECKSEWVQHFKLSDDLQSDPKGIEARALEGLDAVNYLDPGGLVKHASWVFHHVTKALIDAGYVEGHDLDAASYDWRIPPSRLEPRDSYFSNTMKKIETMYEQNDNTSVVLLCHSMGCKTCHYFLNFAKAKEGAGQEWIDKYVHTYFPVGAPHLGVPKSLRSTIVGDKMSLDAFLSEEEALICARSFGSIPWMYSFHLPPGTPPSAYLRREGVLHVTIAPFDCEEMVRDRKTKPSKLRLAVTYKTCTLYSSVHSPEGEKFTVTFPETFTFAAPPNLPSDASMETIRISLYEPGVNFERKLGICTRLSNCLGELVDAVFPVQWWRRIPCVKAHDEVRDAIANAAVMTANIATGALGSATLLADSEQRHLYEHLTRSNNPAEFSLQLRFGNLRKMRKELVAGKKPRKDIVLGETSTIPVTVRVEWVPPQHDVNTNELYVARVALPSEDFPYLHVHSAKDKGVPYEAVNGVQLLKSEFLPRIRDVVMGAYEPDPIGPRTLSSESAPPVKWVKAVYGVDLPTEVSAVYRRRDIVQKEGRLKCLHEMDTSARIESDDFDIKNGLILETRKTPQRVCASSESETGTVIHRSGDGTVPYFSLQQSRRWKKECDVDIVEIPQAEHREILADERFLKILLDYVTEPVNSDIKATI